MERRVVIAGLRAAWSGLRHVNRAGYIYIWCNVAWALLTLLIIPAPAAWAGMIRLSWTAQREPTAGWSDFWQGFKDNFWRGIPIALANVVFWVIFITNLISYASAEGAIYIVLRGVWVITALVVIVAQLYAGVLYYAMKEPSIRGAFRNALVMITLNPFFTLGLVIVIAIVAVLSSLLPLAWILITGGAIAAMTVAAVIDRLRAAGILQDEDTPSYMVDPSFSDV